MIITLNLISDQQRRRIRHGLAAGELRSVAVTTLFVAALASVTLFGARHLLSTTRDLFTNDLHATAADAAVADADVAAAELVEATLAAGTDWHAFLATLAAAVPSGVRLSAVSIDPDGSVQLAGQAGTRAALLELLDRLRASGAVADLYSPVRNLLQPTDVTFEITGRLATSTAP